MAEVGCVVIDFGLVRASVMTVQARHWLPGSGFAVISHLLDSCFSLVLSGSWTWTCGLLQHVTAAAGFGLEC